MPRSARTWRPSSGSWAPSTSGPSVPSIPLGCARRPRGASRARVLRDGTTGSDGNPPAGARLSVEHLHPHRGQLRAQLIGALPVLGRAGLTARVDQAVDLGLVEAADLQTTR